MTICLVLHLDYLFRAIDASTLFFLKLMIINVLIVDTAKQSRN